VSDAPEPTNIIWENLQITEETQKWRKIFVFIVIAIFTIGLFVFFTFLKVTAARSQ
jgi:hypothetical protein